MKFVYYLACIGNPSIENKINILYKNLFYIHNNIKCDFDFFDNEQTFYKFGAKAPRSNCLLDNSKLISAGVKIRTVEKALEDSLKKWK